MNLLIIFIKNPRLGTVKTRLAVDIGDEQALAVYQQLLNKTKTVTDSNHFSKWLFYSDYVEENDLWAEGFEKKVQVGYDLGERISNAFSAGFEAGYSKIAIIGSDCFELDTSTLKLAFHTLEKNDFVIGPANDGGYYLLGMNSYYPALFENKTWSTEDVLPQTIADIEKAGKSFQLLKTMTDIDTLSDLRKFPEIKF